MGETWNATARRPDPTGERAKRRRNRCTLCWGKGAITRLVPGMTKISSEGTMGPGFERRPATCPCSTRS